MVVLGLLADVVRSSGWKVVAAVLGAFDAVGKVERHDFAVATWSGNPDLDLAVSGRRRRGNE